MKTKTMEFDGQAYEISELTIGQALPILPRLTGEDAGGAQIELLNACVKKDGQSIEVSDLPFSMFSGLLQAALDVNGFSSGE